MKFVRRIVLALAALGVLAGGYALVTADSWTLQGVNYQVSARTVPVYVKAIDFVHRHYQYRLLASEIAGAQSSDTDRVLAVFEWTRRNIRPTPEGWPVVDDHIANIIIRGHGVNDQIADVFATLSTYAGIPAFWKKVRPRHGEGTIFTFARVDDKWVPFDAWNGIVFRNRRGELASVEELISDPALIGEATEHVAIAGVNYTAVISRETLSPFVVPRRLRADMQKPWPRVVYETRRAIGLEHEE